MSTPAILPMSAGLTPINMANHDSPDKIRESATQFESLLIAQMLRSARESGGGGLTGSGDDDEDEANSTLLDMGEQQFAQVLAANGGLGIAKIVVAGLTNHADR